LAAVENLLDRNCRVYAAGVDARLKAAPPEVPPGASEYTNKVHADTATVRTGEELNISALRDHLAGKIEGVEDGLEIHQFPGGHSNLTYLLRCSAREYVLRRAPLGPVAPKAHDMAREYRVLAAVHPHFPEAPAVYYLCEDPAVIGAVFFLMERRHGYILRDHIPEPVAAVPDYPARVSEAFIDCMARLHAVDLERHGLLTLGKPEGFVERQVKGWADRWHRAKVEDVPMMDDVIRWLEQRLPASGTPTLVHNDYKLDNVMLDRDSPDRIGAVLDWEMTTVGDPLADVGLTLCYWVWANADDVRAAGIPAITNRPGWFTRDRFIERYEGKTGRDMSGVGYHEVLGIFKLAVIIQQIYVRFHRGQTSDERFREFGGRAKSLVSLAARLAEKYS
jgi:aminoglycoside phosphotransferase (APT) family kinase protein